VNRFCDYNAPENRALLTSCKLNFTPWSFPQQVKLSWSCNKFNDKRSSHFYRATLC